MYYNKEKELFGKISGKEMKYIAHINEKKEIQYCDEHCKNTANYAQEDLAGIGLGQSAYIAGLLHDCGKFTNDFLEYINKSAEGQKVKKGSVIHTFAGVYYLLKTFHTSSEEITYKDVSSEILSVAIASHHGLIDCIDSSGVSGLKHRQSKQPEYEKEAIKNYLSFDFNEEEINCLFEQANDELTQKYTAIQELSKNESELDFYLGMLERVLLSALIDGDRRDTAEFMCGIKFDKYKTKDANMWHNLLCTEEKYLSNFKCETEIEKARKELSDKCGAFASNESGIYRLNIPTGGGKTLSGLRYALAHAEKYNKSRVFYIAPLISILDQNANVIRKAVNNNDVVLEHHSSVIPDEEDGENVNKYSVLTETWDSPIVITTLVQFLNTLFSGKTACIRRMNALCNSVIILDEVQTVPINMLSIFNLAINFLHTICNATVLLCSATQPCFETTEHKMLVNEKTLLSEKEEKKYARIFKRTEIRYKGNYPLNEIPELADGIMNASNSLLIVCNKKAQAEYLFSLIKKKTDYKVFHLSASMCPAHRKNMLNELSKSLEAREKTVCLSTQVIEAGIDISFEAVIRFCAGIDSIVQAAGRCNRNKERNDLSDVYIINCLDERLTSLREINEAKDASLDMLEQFRQSEERFDHDIASDKAIAYYYKKLYKNTAEGRMDFYIKGKETTIYNLLTENYVWADKCEDQSLFYMKQAFKSAGENFTVLDSDTRTVIVPYGNGKQIIQEICSEKAQKDILYLKELLKKAKDYSVSVYEYQYKKLLEKYALFSVNDVLILNEDFYDKDIGITNEEKGGEEECNIQIL